MPKVSLGIPVYNGENFVGQAIESVLAQSFQDWELIISDNASTDGTPAICRNYAAQDDRIHYYRADVNRGAAWNFNRVFELAKGEYFRWLSHDDYLAPTAIAECCELLDAHPEVLMCATKTGAIDADGYRILDDTEAVSDLTCQGLTPASERLRVSLSASDSAAERYRGILLYSRRCHEIYGLTRRNVMATTQLHPSYSGGEKVLLAELALLGPIHEIPHPLFFVRWHGERFTANRSAREQEEHMSAAPQRRFVFPHQYRATLGYLQLIRRLNLSALQRLRCLAVWLRFTLQVSKWIPVLKNTLTGTATSATLQGAIKRGELVHSPLVDRRLPEPTDPLNADLIERSVSP